MRIVFFVLIFLFLFSCSTIKDDVYLESQLKKAMVIGKVITEEGLPLEGVIVKLNSIKDSRTDISGRFFFTYVAYGKYNITFKKDGFLPETYELDYNFKNRKQQPFIKVKMLSTNFLVSEGFEFLKEKKFKETFEIIEKLEKINPDEDIVLYLKAIYNYLNARFVEALPLLEKLKLRDRKNIYYQLTLCDIYNKLEQYDKEADQAYYIGSNNPREYYGYLKRAAQIYQSKLNNEKEYEKSIAEYNKYKARYGSDNN